MDGGKFRVDMYAKILFDIICTRILIATITYPQNSVPLTVYEENNKIICKVLM